MMFKHGFFSIYLWVIEFEYLLGVKYLIMKLLFGTSNATAETVLLAHVTSWSALPPQKAHGDFEENMYYL